MTACHLGLGTKRCPKIWTNVATAIGLSEKPSSTHMWIQHIHSATSLLDPLIMYIKKTAHTQFENNPLGPVPLRWCMVQFRAATVETRRACRVLGTLIEKSWFVLRWRTWWGVCSEDWELNNVEKQHTYTHIYTHTQWWCVSASPCCSWCSQAERSRPSAQQHREK